MSRVQVLRVAFIRYETLKKVRFRQFESFDSKKYRKWIYGNSKKVRVEKSGEISRNLRFSRFFSVGSKSTVKHGRGRRIRTRDPRFWRPVLYQLSYTPVFLTCLLYHTCRRFSICFLKKLLFFCTKPSKYFSAAIEKAAK